MNCPKCGEPLRISKKDPAFGLCDHCKKKFRLPESTTKDEAVAKKADTRPSKESTLDSTDPVLEPSKPITDETKVMKAIQSIDEETASDIPAARPTPKKRRPADQESDVPKKRRPADQESGAPKKRRAPEKKQPQKHSQSGYYTDDQYDDEPHHKKKKYANIPPSKVRSSREDDMRAGYDELLSIENEKQGVGSKILTIILLIIVLALIGGGVFYLYNRVSGGKASSAIDAAANEKTAELADNGEVVYADDEIEVLI